MPIRSGSNPKRRVVAIEKVSQTDIERLAASVRYVGSGHHKRNPADYGFERINPRPTKSICDMTGVVPLAVAETLILSGIRKRMMSEIQADGFPKFIWSVSDDQRVYESKTYPNTPEKYHGYPLEKEDDMQAYILSMWSKR